MSCQSGYWWLRKRFWRAGKVGRLRNGWGPLGGGHKWLGSGKVSSRRVGEGLRDEMGVYSQTRVPHPLLQPLLTPPPPQAHPSLSPKQCSRGLGRDRPRAA